jgi:hypothetical protein
MKEFLKRIKLIDYLTVNLGISRKEFVERLSSVVDEGKINRFSNPFEIFSSSKNEFIGQVNSEGFILKRRRRFFDTNQTIIIAKGTLSEQNGQLTIETEINGFKSSLVFIYVILVIFYSGFMIMFLNTDNKDKSLSILFLLIHGVFMFSLPYFLLKRSVKKMKHELERELFFLTKNN